MLNDGVRSVFGGSSVRWMFGGSLGVGVGRGEQRLPDVWYSYAFIIHFTIHHQFPRPRFPASGHGRGAAMEAKLRSLRPPKNPLRVGALGRCCKALTAIRNLKLTTFLYRNR